MTCVYDKNCTGEMIVVRNNKFCMEEIIDVFAGEMMKCCKGAIKKSVVLEK